MPRKKRVRRVGELLRFQEWKELWLLIGMAKLRGLEPAAGDWDRTD